MGGIGAIGVILLLLTTGSVVIYDSYTYADRQSKWEKGHPGKTYIPRYKRLMRTGQLQEAKTDG